MNTSKRRKEGMKWFKESKKEIWEKGLKKIQKDKGEEERVRDLDMKDSPLNLNGLFTSFIISCLTILCNCYRGFQKNIN